jgi:hypothetical protein
MDEALDKLLALVCRELEADDARVEWGGRPPRGDDAIYCSLPGGARLVALYDGGVPSERHERRARLELLAAAFGGTEPPIRDLGVSPTVPPERALDDELAALAARARAIGGAIVDGQSPVLWASAELRRNEEEDVTALAADAELATAAQRAGLDAGALARCSPADLARGLVQVGVARDEAEARGRELRRMRERSPDRDEEGWRRHLLLARAVTAARALPETRQAVHEAQLGYFVRSLGGPYLLVLAFEGAFSELHAEGAALRALPRLKRLVESLPPRDPEGGGGGKASRQNVVRLWPR